MVKLTVKTEHKINASVARELKNFERQAKKNPSVNAGYPSEKVEKGLIQIAGWIEYGTVNMPSRPFLRRALYGNRSKYRRQLIKIAKQAANGANLETLLKRQGAKVVKDIQRSMTSGSFAPLARITAERKRSRRPLITRSKRLYNGVTYFLTKKGR